MCVVDEGGKVVWRGVYRSEPDAMAAIVRKRAPGAVRVVLESGTLSTWHWHGLRALEVPVVCVDTRQDSDSIYRASG